MKIMGLMLVKNEDWILGLSARVALRYCDEILFVDDRSTDASANIMNELAKIYPWRVHYSRWEETEEVDAVATHPGSRTLMNPNPPAQFKRRVPTRDGWWNEMDARQHSLLLGRRYGGTHFVMVDADEILTANLAERAREDIARLSPGEVLEYPMYAMRSLDEYQNDGSEWCGRQLSFAFCDAPQLTWKPDPTHGYHHHHRLPYGTKEPPRTPIAWGKGGGIFHMQFANRRRLLAKHVLYRMVDHLRWPGRRSPADLNRIFDMALRPPGSLTKAPGHWWGDYERELVDVGGWPWHEGEVLRLLEKHGREAFAGLDLKGFDK